jgi:tetratricopeptide (TPR) repeat protein
MAYRAASDFLLARREIDEAIRYSARAFRYAPDHISFLEQTAHLHLLKGEYRQALEYLERAERQEPENPDVAKLAGWAYYGQNRIKDAVEEWRRAYRLRPDPDVKKALEKAERDKQTESTYREGETRHFALRYHGEAEPELAREVLRILEIQFADIERMLNYTPGEPIGVILYTREAFTDVTQAPAWAGAINDGRIRIPVQGLASVTPALARKLKHELAHSFITLKTRGNAPVWVHEGIAQWLEGSRSDLSAAALVEAYSKEAYLPLANLEGSIMEKSPTVVQFAYAWSLAVVEYIAEAQGAYNLERILDRLAAGGNTESALRETLRMSYARLEEETAAYLKKTYLR